MTLSAALPHLCCTRSLKRLQSPARKLEAFIRENPEFFEALIEEEQRQAQAELTVIETELDRQGAPVLQPLSVQPLPGQPAPTLKPLTLDPAPTLTPLPQPTTPVLKPLPTPEPGSRIEALRLDPKPTPGSRLEALKLDAKPTHSGPAITPAQPSRLDQLLLRADALRQSDPGGQEIYDRLTHLREEQPATRVLQIASRRTGEPITIGVSVDAQPAPALRDARPVQLPSNVGVAPAKPVAQPVPTHERTWGEWAGETATWVWEGLFGS